MTKVFLSPFRNKRITNGHPWIYDNEVKKIEGDFENGDIVEVYDAHKKIYWQRLHQFQFAYIGQNFDLSTPRGN